MKNKVTIQCDIEKGYEDWFIEQLEILGCDNVKKIKKIETNGND